VHQDPREEVQAAMYLIHESRPHLPFALLRTAPTLNVNSIRSDRVLNHFLIVIVVAVVREAELLAALDVFLGEDCQQRFFYIGLIDVNRIDCAVWVTVMVQVPREVAYMVRIHTILGHILVQVVTINIEQI